MVVQPLRDEHCLADDRATCPQTTTMHESSRSSATQQQRILHRQCHIARAATATHLSRRPHLGASLDQHGESTSLTLLWHVFDGPHDAACARAAWQSLTLGVQPRVEPPLDAPSIVREVRAFVIGSKDLEERSGGGADCHSQVRGPSLMCVCVCVSVVLAACASCARRPRVWVAVLPAAWL